MDRFLVEMPPTNSSYPHKIIMRKTGRVGVGIRDLTAGGEGVIRDKGVQYKRGGGSEGGRGYATILCALRGRLFRAAFFSSQMGYIDESRTVGAGHR